MKRTLQIIQGLLFALIIFALTLSIINHFGNELKGFWGFSGTTEGIIALAVVPCVLLVILFIAIRYEKTIDAKKVEKPKDTTAPIKEVAVPSETSKFFVIPKGTQEKITPQQALEAALNKIQVLREKPRVTPKMLLKPTQKLERLKNRAEFRKDVVVQQKIKKELNWCYKQLGGVKYDVGGTKKKTKKKQPAKKQSPKKI